MWDPTDKGYQPRGKQIDKPHGIWYTPVTGIWQTVWLEPVPKSYIGSLKIDAGLGQDAVPRSPQRSRRRPPTRRTLRVGHRVNDRTDRARFPRRQSRTEVKSTIIRSAERELWSPDDPHSCTTCGCSVSKNRHGRCDLDDVDSYFGMRKIEVTQGRSRRQSAVPQQQAAVPDTARSTRAGGRTGSTPRRPTRRCAYDIEVTKKLGFNMARKHVKVEPARWYYHCDKLGLLVWQDMPSGDRHIAPQRSGHRAVGRVGGELSPRVAGDHRRLRQPSRAIVIWVPFNEGWGQFKTERDPRLDQEARPDAAGRRRQRLDRPRRRRHARHPHAIPAPACSRSRTSGPSCSASSAGWACR